MIMKKLPLILVLMAMLFFPKLNAQAHSSQNVSIQAELSLNEALQVLENFSYSLLKKRILNMSDYGGAIGIPINNLPWEMALDLILLKNDLQRTDKVGYIAIEDKPQTASSSDFSPERNVNFEATLPLNEALLILEYYSTTFLKKKIINMSDYGGTIGIPINNLPWDTALDLIVLKNNLVRIDKAGYLAIEDKAQALSGADISLEKNLSFPAEMQFNEALLVLERYSTALAKKKIFNMSDFSGTIGIPINSLPWETALDLILLKNNLYRVDKAGYISIESKQPLTSYLKFSSEENINFAPELPLNEALLILENYSVNLLKKKILNMSAYNGSIGIPINNLPWETALELILLKNNLMRTDKAGYLAIEDKAQTAIAGGDKFSPDQKLNIAADTSLNEALLIIENYSLAVQNKKILNVSDYSGNIGIPISNLGWEEALEMITLKNKLQRTDKAGYIAIENSGQKITDLPPQPPNPLLATAKDKQVRIKAVAMLADRSFVRQLGIDWSAAINGKVPVDISLAAASTLSSIFNVSANGSFTSGNTSVDIDALMKLIETNQKGSIIAKPNIMVSSGKKGYIQVGQDISIKMVDEAGNTTDNFFATGVIMDVTPTVLDVDGEEVVHLQLSIERSSGVPSAVSTIITKSTSNTEVILFNNEETVIAGLFDTDETLVRSGIPILKDLPWWVFGIRYLTGYNTIEKKDRELVISLQVEIVDNATMRKAKASEISQEDLTEAEDKAEEQNSPESSEALPQDKV